MVPLWTTATAVLVLVAQPYLVRAALTTEELEQCMADPATLDMVNASIETGLKARIWNIPSTPSVGSLESIALNSEFPFLIPREGFEWHANVLPREYDFFQGAKIQGLPPPFLNLLCCLTNTCQQFPFWNFQKAARWGYKKFGGIPKWILAYANRHPANFTESQTIFQTNFQDRGPDNERKKMYLVSFVV